MLSFAGRDNTIDTSALVKPAPPGGQWTRAFATHRVRLVTEVCLHTRTDSKHTVTMQSDFNGVAAKFEVHQSSDAIQVWEFFAGLIVHLASVTTASCVQSQVRTIVVLVVWM